MTDQNTFMETVNNVAEIIRTSAEPMPEKEIMSYFEDMDLSDDQKKLVMEYLMNPEKDTESDILPEEGAESGNEQEEYKETEEDSKVFQMYMEDLSLLPVYSKEETEALYKQLLQGEETVMETISVIWLKEVLEIAKKYLEPRLRIEDLIQEGNMALFLKLRELCGCREKQDVEETLRDAVEEGIMSYASEMNREREQESTLVGKLSLVHEARKMLAEEKGYDPSIQELSEYTKMSVEELTELEDFLKENEKNS
ncbi:MAG: hypothetical protein ACI4A3_09855 [Lachnospiraceae bacterium]